MANDFSAQWREIREDALAAVERVGRSGWLILGQEVEAFERELADWWGVAHAVGVASGMDALEIALRCAGAGPGERVLTTPLTAFATTLAILRVGAQPVWCDVDSSGSLDLERAAAVLRADPGIRFLMPVHLYGHPLDPAALAEIQRACGVTVIEDCAQSAGARREGLPTGTVGLAAGLSLYPTKNLGAMGDGGVLLTADADLAQRARRLRNYGQGARYEHLEEGLNSRLDELHAAILRSAMLPRLDAWVTRRREIAELYVHGLRPLAGRLEPLLATGGTSANHLFAVEVVGGDPQRFRAGLEARGIAAGRHYPLLCPEQPAISGRGQVCDPLENARRIARREVSLPIHPQLSDADAERVIAACLEAAQ